MTDRRGADRRQSDQRVSTDRRHGERRTYKAGCHCRACRAAEADYRAHLRWRRAHQQEILGALVDAEQTWHLLRLLRPDYFGYKGLAQALGIRDARGRIRFGRQRVRLATQQLVEAEYRRVS